MSEPSTQTAASLEVLSENGVPLSAEAVRQCEESAAAEFAREFLQQQRQRIVPLVYKRTIPSSIDDVGDRTKPNPDYV